MANLTSITTHSNTGGLTYGNGILPSGNWTITSPVLSASSATVGIDYSGQFTNWEFAIFTCEDEKLDTLLSTSYKEIRDNYICFNVYIQEKAVRPLEDILMMINKKDVFNLLIKRGGYNISINNVRFTKIKNLIESSAKEYIEVEFNYDNIEYDNTLKSVLDKRSEKMDLLKHKINK
jgi:hypothetical protein